MLRQVVAVVTTFGVAFVASGLIWRYVCPRFVDLPESDDLTLLAVRDGVAAGLVAIGLGIALTGVGALELYGSVGGPTVAEEPLVALATLVPIREIGGAVLAVGFALVVGSLLVPTGTEARRRFRG